MNNPILLVCTAFFFSLISSFILTNIVRRYSVRWGLMDIPADRKLHTIPLPRSGGLAIVTAFLLVNILWQIDISSVWHILIGTAAIAILGFWDDKAGLKPKLKFIGQIVVACISVFGFGIQIQLFPSEVINQLISIFWIVGITNSLNLLDNMDGLSTGITIIASVFLLFFAVQSQQIALAMLAVSLMGSCFGFLFHNFHPASIFMGDMGSMTLGYLLAVLGIMIKVDPNWSLTRFISDHLGFPVSNLQFITALVPLLILGLPLFDTTLVTVFRRLSGRSIADGGKDHTSHRIVALKVRERTAVLILYLVASCLGLSAVAIVYGNLLISTITFILLLTALILGVLKLSSARVYLINRRLLNELRSPYTNILKNFFLRNRKKMAFLILDICCLALAFIASFFIVYELRIASILTSKYLLFTIPVVLVLIASLQYFDVYFHSGKKENIWKEIGSVLQSLFLGNLLLLSVFFFSNIKLFRNAIFVNNFVLDIILIEGFRLFYRWKLASKKQRVLLVGTSTTVSKSAGQFRKYDDRKLIGCVDVNAENEGQFVYRLPVLGKLIDINQIIINQDIDEVVITSPALCENNLKDLEEFCNENNTAIRLEYIETNNNPILNEDGIRCTSFRR
ncbi:hypothetical protein ACFL57_02245 [Candidatus Margulisiibacteriota bacterium]